MDVHLKSNLLLERTLVDVTIYCLTGLKTYSLSLGRFRFPLRSTLNVRVGCPCHVMSTFGSPIRCAHVLSMQAKTCLDLHVPYHIDQHCLSPLSIACHRCIA